MSGNWTAFPGLAQGLDIPDSTGLSVQAFLLVLKEGI
jgi:hypothetical protein